MSNSLVFLSQDKTTPLTSTFIIAKALNRDTNDINKLIVKFKSDFEEFGTIAISDLRHIKMPNGGYKNINDYYLNEQQATLLVTYLRNSEIVRKFKIALVKAFFEMRNALNGNNLSYSKAEIKEIRRKGIKTGYYLAIQNIKAGTLQIKGTETDRITVQKAKELIAWIRQYKSIFAKLSKLSQTIAPPSLKL